MTGQKPLPDADWIATALAITGGFETAGLRRAEAASAAQAGDPFAAVAGDFDGQGLSCGALQWNVGQGTLQPLVKAAGEAAVLAIMPQWGARFWAAMAAPKTDALATLRAWQTGGRLDPAFASELRSFLTSPAMRAQQIAASRRIAARALRMAAAWSQSRGEDAPTKQEFCWFFDLVTQNGGLKGLTSADVRVFTAGQNEPEAAICDWLVARAAPEFGWHDARKNAGLWREAPAGARDLFVLSYLRARKCTVRSHAVAMNRKGTIARLDGWVNERLFDLSLHLSPNLTVS